MRDKSKKASFDIDYLRHNMIDYYKYLMVGFDV